MSKMVLIAEDDPFIGKITSSRLKQDGFEVLTVQDGEAAIDAALNQSVDILLLDLIMPKKTGFEVLKAIQDKVTFPILVFSNLSQEQDRNEVLSLGASEYFVKTDVALDQMTEIIKKYLN